MIKMIVFFSTRLTPHQIPFCNEMNILCDKFYFIQLDNLGDEWESKGQIVRSFDYPYLLKWNDNIEFCQKIILEADALIAGGVDSKLFLERLKKRKLTYIYLERFYKNGINLHNFLRVIIGTFIHHNCIQRYTPYLLCASGYCAGDASVFHNYNNRTFKWGYFPSVTKNNYSSAKKQNSILWVGRLIDVKHPEVVVMAASELQKKGVPFSVEIVGDGPLMNQLKDMVIAKELNHCVKLLGARSSAEVRTLMQKASIFVFSSDYKEGWGAVINEAMDSECVVVSSHCAGATPFLIKNGKTGFVYEYGNETQLVSILELLLNNPEYTKEVGLAAADYLRTEWSPKNAAKRFIEVSEQIINKNDFFSMCTDGPMSKAEPIKQKKLYKWCVKK